MSEHDLFSRHSNWIRMQLWFLPLVCLILLFPLLIPTPAHADSLPPGIHKYYVLGYEYHMYRMYRHAGVTDDIPPLGTGDGYMASIVDLTITADDQIIFYDHWEDGYEVDILNPNMTNPVTGTLVLGDGNPDNGNAADFIAGRTGDILKAGDSLPLSSRYHITGASAITGVMPIDPRDASEFRFDGGDLIVSTGGPIGLVHAMWPVDGSGGSFTDHTWAGDSWEIYSAQALEDAFRYTTPIGENLAGRQFANVDLQIQALEDNTNVTVNNQDGQEVTFQLDQGETYFSGDGDGYIDNNSDDMLPYGNLDLDVQSGTVIVADKPVQVGLVAYHNEVVGGWFNNFQDRFYNMIPASLWDKYYIMPTGDNPSGGDGNSDVYIYNPNTFTITVTSADTSGENDPFEVAPTSVVSYQLATGASTPANAIPTLSGVSLSSDAHFWAIHVADAYPNHGMVYDWGNTFLPLFFLTDEYYASWAPGNVNLPPDGNGSPLWVTAIEDNTHLNVDYDNDDTIDESFLLNALQVIMLRDDTDNDQSGTRIWTEDGQKIAVIWGEDAVVAGDGSPYLDVGHMVLPIMQEWIAPVYFFDKDTYPKVLPEAGGDVRFNLKATTSFFADVSNLVLTDTLPVDWTYINGSTVISYPNGSIGGFDPTTSTVTSTIAGGRVATHTVLFWDLGTNLLPEQSVELQFQAAISNPRGSIGPRHSDGFESTTYNGGTGPWLSDWAETGEPTDPLTGNIRITDTAVVVPYDGDWQLSIRDDLQTISRALDLNSFTRPILRFKRYFRALESGDAFGIQISVDGSSYVPVLTWTNPGEDTWVQEEIDLSPYITDTVFILFRGISADQNDFLYLDDVQVHDSFTLHTNEATARAQYFDYDFMVHARKNVYLAPFRLVKQVNAKSVALGSTVVFTLTYSGNSDTVTGTNFIIKDTLPPGLLFAGASHGGVYITETNTVSWTIGTILTNTRGTRALTVTLVNTIRPKNGDPIENTANLINDEYLVRSNLTRMTALAPDLRVTKSAPSSAHPGDLITYTIEYENRGSITATNAFITDAIPANTTYALGSCTGCTYDGSALTWNLGDIAPDDAGSLSFAVHVADTVALGTNIQNVALIKHDYLSGPEQAIANTKVSEVTLAKRANTSLAGPGQILTFTLNYGAMTDTMAFVVDAIPGSTEYIAGSATSSAMFTPTYSTDGGITYQDIEPIPASSVSHLRWEVHLISGTVGLLGFHVQVDTDLDNDVTIQNQASLTATGVSKLFSNRVSIPTVKLALDKRGPNIVGPGETFTYTLHLSNYGSGDATVMLSDTLPTDVTYISASPTPSSINPITWSLTIPANTSDLDYTIVVSVTDTIPLGAELRNEATLNSDQHTVADSFLTYVAQEYVTIVPNNTGSGHQTDDLCYGHIVFNNSAVSDTVNLPPTHSLWSAPVRLYKDVNGNGTYQPSTDTPLIDTNTDSITDTGLIVADSFVRILVCLTIPEDVADGSSNVTTIRATSTENPSRFDEATDTTTVEIGPGLSVDKTQRTVNGAPLYPGNEIAYTITVTNQDTIIHTNLVITDAAGPDFGFVPNSGAIEPSGEITIATSAMTATHLSLGPGQTITITLRAKLLSTVNAGSSVTNTAYADSTQQGPSASASSVATAEAGLLSRKLAADLDGPPLEISDTIRYTILVTNTSTTYLHTHVAIYDTLPVSATFAGNESIAPSGSIVYLAGPHAISATVPSLGPQQVAAATFDVTLNPDTANRSITNTAAISSSEQNDPPPPDPVCPDGSVSVGGVCPATPVMTVTLTVAKTPDTQMVQSGGTVTFAITVTNTGNADLSSITVVDAQAPDCNRSLGSLSHTDNTSYTCHVADVTSDFTNHVIVTGTPPVGNVVTDTDTADVIVINPAIEIAKTPDYQATLSGGTVTFTIAVTNTGDVTLTNVAVSDAWAPNCDANLGDLFPSESDHYTCTATATNDFTNVATVTGSPPVGPDVSGSDAAFVEVIGPSIQIAKSPDVQKIVSGSTATFTIAITNTGDADLADVSVTDALVPSCARPSLGSLAVGNGTHYTCTVGNVTSDFVNSATAKGTPPAPPDVYDTDTAFVDVLPTIAVTKTANPVTLPEPGGAVTFAVRVDNTSAETITLTSLNDDVYGNLDGQGTCVVTQTIPVGSSYSCVFIATISGNAGDIVTDIVTAQAQDDESNTASDDDDATVSLTDVLPTISVVKTANPTSVNVPGGDVTFTVRVDNTSVEAVNLITLTDDVHGDLDGRGTCAVTQTIPVTGYYECAFVATVSGSDGYTETDTITAWVQDDEGNTVSENASAAVTVSGFATIYGTVFDDADGDGVQEAGEDGLPDVLITLDGNITTTTDITGSYTFSTTIAGIHTVVETDPDGYSSTTPNEVLVNVTMGNDYIVNFGDILGLPPTCTCDPDSYEEDDNPTQATPIQVGFAYSQTHDFCDDAADWTSLTAQAGDIYTITTSSWATRTDTFLALFDADKRFLTANDDYAGTTDLSSRIVWQAPVNGMYYMRVTNQAGLTGCNTDYDIWIEHQDVIFIYLPLVMKNYSATNTTHLDISSASSPSAQVEQEAVLSPAGIITHICPDAYEVDDTWQDATPITGTIQVHSFDSNPELYAADKDYVWFDVSLFHVTNGKTITFTITAITNTQPLMQLHDAYGVALDVTGTFTTPLVWTSDDAGRYYLSVRPNDRITAFANCTDSEAGYNLRLEMDKVYPLHLPLVMRNL
jgi:uncharacterized repeat protein (TIGR01451 family)/fimbrial isopeptide formation D2 family protein